MPKLNAMRIVAILLLGLCGYFYYRTLDYPRGAAILPEALLFLLALCSIGLMIRSGEKLEIKHPGRVLAGTGVCLLYMLAIVFIGYYAASAGIVVVMALILRYRKIPHIVIAAVGYPLAIYVIFEMLLKIPMPTGSWL